MVMVRNLGNNDNKNKNTRVFHPTEISCIAHETCKRVAFLLAESIKTIFEGYCGDEFLVF